MKKVSKRNLLFGILMVVGLSLVVISCSGGGTDPPEVNEPEILNLTANPSSVTAGGTVTLICEADHPDGLPLEYIWDVTGGSISGFGNSVTWIAPALAGQYTVICKVVASNGRQDTANVSINVAETPPPVDDMIISLTWSVSGDMDLSLSEPDGSQTTRFQNGTTGRHSGDVITGTGPETITVEEAIDGIYGIDIRSYSGQLQTATLVVNLRGVATTYTCQVSARAGGRIATAVFPDGRESLVSNPPAGITCM